MFTWVFDVLPSVVTMLKEWCYCLSIVSKHVLTFWDTCGCECLFVCLVFVCCFLLLTSRTLQSVAKQIAPDLNGTPSIVVSIVSSLRRLYIADDDCAFRVFI